MPNIVRILALICALLSIVCSLRRDINDIKERNDKMGRSTLQLILKIIALLFLPLYVLFVIF